MVNPLLPQWPRRSKDFSFDTSSSAFTVLVELKIQQKDEKTRERMTFKTLKQNSEHYCCGEFEKRASVFILRQGKVVHLPNCKALFRMLPFTSYKWCLCSVKCSLYSRSLVFVISVNDASLS